MSLDTRLDQITSVTSSKDQTCEYQKLIDEHISGSSAAPITRIITRFMSNDVQQSVSKSLILYMAKKLKDINEEILEEIGNHLLVLIKQHTLSFDEAEYFIRETMFNYYVKNGLYKDAATTLSSVNVDSTTHHLAEEEKTDLFVRCAEAALEDDETIDAEVFLNRASSYIQSATGWSLLLRYRVTCARVLDNNRKFVEAAMRYLELSNIQNTEVDSEDLLELLGKAVTCAVLGRPGPQRSRVLGLLYKDERIHTLDLIPKYSGHSSVLTKMFTNQLLRKDELTAFESCLMKHQMAIAGDGLTIPERAVIEHNMVAAGRIYDNIRFPQLASLLRLDVTRAERVAARMIGEYRLKATIDQTEGILQFEEDSDALLSWNDGIADLCAEVSECVESLQLSYPTINEGARGD
mmetsp:Transcript_35381/g.36046  ORF Transcript_35381/g.36046 Transcript_35381/m.36046 type:complete len:407 (-) Transcript_35381:73-1293(-)